jgi:hypothetical protein
LVPFYGAIVVDGAQYIGDEFSLRSVSSIMGADRCILKPGRDLPLFGHTAQATNASSAATIPTMPRMMGALQAGKSAIHDPALVISETVTTRIIA